MFQRGQQDRREWALPVTYVSNRLGLRRSAERLKRRAMRSENSALRALQARSRL
jgi:hypothetical protein